MQRTWGCRGELKIKLRLDWENEGRGGGTRDREKQPTVFLLKFAAFRSL